MRGFNGRTARAACVAALVALTGAAPAFAAVELDQSAMVIDDGANIGAIPLFFGLTAGGYYTSFVQSVTAGKGGLLDHIDVQLARRSAPGPFPPEGSVTLRLYDGDLAAGPANLIASQTIAVADVPLITGTNFVPTDYVGFDVRAANFLVANGQKFSFSFDFVPPSQAYSAISAFIGLGRMSGSTIVPDFNNYAGGQLNALSSLSDDVGIVEPGDVGFRSFVDVEPGAVPEPASWALMIGGFALAGGAMRRRKVETLRFV